LSKAEHALPVQPMTLTSTPERLEPALDQLEPEGVDRPDIAWHCVELSPNRWCTRG
jgi:hypothetical protein